jgi:NAD(P)-dependent dehydrogenase (short-subunit alcohol dehydrogenase family)
VGGVDVLVNNATTNPDFGPTIDVDRRAWDKIVEVNLWAPLRWTQLAAQTSLGCGSVINVSSNLALTPGCPPGVYGMSKAALLHLTQQLATELGPTVRVNAIAPGVVDSWSRSGTANWRFTRSPAVGVSCFGQGRRDPGRPLIPARRISSSTVPCPTMKPWPRVNSACTRRAP